MRLSSVKNVCHDKLDKKQVRQKCFGSKSKRNKTIEWIFCAIIIAVLTVGFYFLLAKLNTDNLIVSTMSLVPSLAATYCILRRSEYYSICLFNDIYMVILWGFKLSNGLEALPNVIAFSFFIINDSYSFINWQKVKKRQNFTNFNADGIAD